MSSTPGRERKPITVLFADIVDSTAMAEQLDPEDWAALMNGAFDLMAQAIQRYEGTVAQFLGNGILAFFGAPIAHEDDPQRAVWAALEIVEEAGKLSPDPERRRGLENSNWHQHRTGDPGQCREPGRSLQPVLRLLEELPGQTPGRD